MGVESKAISIARGEQEGKSKMARWRIGNF